MAATSDHPRTTTHFPQVLRVGACSILALLITTRFLVAQPLDPPNTEYLNGDDRIDTQTLRALPVEPGYRAYIPASVDLSYRLPEPGDQGRANSCSAWAVAYAARSYYTSAQESRDTRLSENIASPGFVYNLARQLLKKGGCEGSSNIPAAVEAMKRGSPSLRDYPYHASDCDPPPSPEVIASAADFRTIGLSVVDHKKIDDVKGRLAQSHPVMISFHDDEAWHRHRGEGVFSRATVDREAGWHSMTLVGYDERKQAFRLINSWGKGWGDGGYGWLSYDAFKERVRFAAVLQVPRVKAPVSRPTPQPNVAMSRPQPLPAGPQPPATQAQRPPPVPSRPPPAVEVRPAPGPEIAVKPTPAVEAPPASIPPSSPPPEQQRLSLSDLTTLSCSKIAARKDGRRNILEGYVGTPADLDLIKRIMADVPGTALGNVMLAPWPQCEAIQTLEKPLSSLDRPTIDIGPRTQFRAGETLRIGIQSPAQISYLYVSYIQADGSVVHLVQPTGLVPAPTRPGQVLTFGDGREGRKTFTINAPFGIEMIIAIASRSPLFDEPLPEHQTEREYLTELRRALLYKPSPDMPDRELSASIQSLRTGPR